MRLKRAIEPRRATFDSIHPMLHYMPLSMRKGSLHGQIHRKLGGHATARYTRCALDYLRITVQAQRGIHRLRETELHLGSPGLRNPAVSCTEDLHTGARVCGPFRLLFICGKERPIHLLQTQPHLLICNSHHVFVDSFKGFVGFFEVTDCLTE